MGQLCEACESPAVTDYDTDGLPFCRECYAQLYREWDSLMNPEDYC